MTGRFEKFTMQLSKLEKSVQKMKTDGMGQFGLKGADTLCLYQLAEGESLTFAEIAQRCELDGALVSRTLRGLVDKGMVERSGDPGRYKACYSLTRQGEERWLRIREIIAQVQQEADRGISEQELTVFYRVLDRLNANFARMNETGYTQLSGALAGKEGLGDLP